MRGAQREVRSGSRLLSGLLSLLLLLSPEVAAVQEAENDAVTALVNMVVAEGGLVVSTKAQHLHPNCQGL